MFERRVRVELGLFLLRGCGLALVAAACGCASPGPPRAPSLRLPEKATRLEAVRTGDAVRVSWEVSRNTTDGDTTRPGMTAVVCRELAGAAAVPCVPVGQMAVSPGVVEFRETLPAALRSGGPVLLGYRVELLNARGRSAGRSDAVYAAGGEAPPAAGALVLTARRHALLIRWTPQRSGVGMELTRTTTATAAGPVTPRRKTQGAGEGKGPGRMMPGPRRDADVVVLAGGTPRDGVDPGGMVDGGVRDLSSYQYVAQRVERVTLAGHALELRGDASPPAAIVFHDRFAPDAPTGLVSVAGITFNGAGAVDQPFIDLSWDVGPDDVTGYNVYRSDGTQGVPFVRLNAHAVVEAGYHDATVTPGVTYIYRVTALDRNGLESAPGVEIHDMVQK